jgi:Holliday junction resolvase
MTHPSKVKGNTFERDIVKEIQGCGFVAKRAYASDGRSLGENEKVDVKAEINGVTYLIQAKIRKAIASWIIPDTDSVDIQIIRQNRGEALVVQPLKQWLEDKC